MKKTIDSLQSTTFAGKRFDRKQLHQIQQTVKRYPHLSLRELGHTLCEHLNWVTPGGRHRIQTCLRALTEMQTVGLFQLPEKRSQAVKAKQKPIQWREHTAPQAEISGDLDQFTAIRVEPVTDDEGKRLFNEYMDRYHYLGYRKPIGNHLRYFIIGQNSQGDTLLGCLLFAFAVNHLACRDSFIGWTTQQREKHLPILINNTRFLVLPWVRIQNLASKALSTVTKRVANDWLLHFGLHPVLIETLDARHPCLAPGRAALRAVKRAVLPVLCRS